MSTHGDGNLILVTIDCLRPDHMSCFGYERETTPVIDEIAESSVLARQCFSNGVTTGTSFPSIMCSTPFFSYAGKTLPPEVPTVAERLSEAGYATAAVSASNPHLSPEFGYARGFDTYVDFLYTRSLEDGLRSEWDGTIPDPEGDDEPDAESGALGALAERYRAYRKEAGEYATKSKNYLDFLLSGEPVALANYASPAGETIVDAATEWLDSRDGEPFFLWLHLMDPHSWYGPERRHLDAIGVETPSRREQVRASRALMDASPFREDGDVSAVEDHLSTILDLYDGTIRQADAAVGTLRDYLEAAGLWADTTLAVAADHGEQFLEHGSVQHGGKPHAELVHVPLVVSNGDADGAELTAPAELNDLPPTLLRAAGVEIPDAYTGRVLPVDGGDPAELDDRTPVSVSHNPRTVVTARDGRYTYLRDDDVELLFDRDADPLEESPLDPGASAWSAERRDTLAARVDAVEFVGDTESMIPDAEDVSTTVEQRLADLGYR
jgi:arylsulfatase A-like enzyme